MASKKKNPTRAVANGAASAVVGVIGTIFRVLGTILLVTLVTGLLFMCIFAYYVKTCLEPEIDVNLDDFTIQLSSSILYQDSSGAWQKMVQLSSAENRIWIDYENIPKDIEHAAVAIEDKRFYEHKGVDWYRTTGAFVNMFLGMKNDFGGSTITQQLIKNTTQQDDITVQRKLLEIFQALKLEEKYTKEQIMEYYLNKVYFGEGCYGIYTAADTYFGKTPDQLTLAECASIVGITNAPTKYDPFINQEENRKRRIWILNEMYDQGYITKAELDQAVKEEPVFVRTENEQKPDVIYNYYTEVVISDVINDLMAQRGLSRDSAKQLVYSGGYQIYSCFDPITQSVVDEIYQNMPSNAQFHASAKGQQFQSAIVVLDPYTGEIKALCGGTGVKESNFVLNRATGSQRPPGSSIKPIAVYGPAMELGLITQNTKVNDSPNVVLAGKPDWLPKNSGGGYSGVITIRTALQRSLNTVSAQILDKLTPQTSFEFLQEKLGVTSLVDADCDYAPLSLGQLTNGITVREMAQAYSAFVNDGVFTYSRTYSYVTDSEGNVVLENPARTISAFQPNTAWNMEDMLYNAVNAGTGSEARLGNMPVGGKTGTTSDNKDRWFVGFTPYLVAAVWTGYDMPEVMNFGGNPASQIWRLVMSQIIAKYQEQGLMPYKDFPVPDVGQPTGIFGTFFTPPPEDTQKPDETGGDTGGGGGGDTGGGDTGGGGGGEGVVL